MAFIVSVITIALLVVCDQLFPMVIFVGAWGAVCVAVVLIATVVNAVTYTLDDPGAPREE